MAVNLTEAPFHRSLRWIPGEGQDGYPCRIPGILILNISSQNSYAVFCFINRGLNSAMRRDGATVRPRLVMAAARGKQVALGQTASAAYAGRRTRGGPAASGFAGPPRSSLPANSSPAMPALRPRIHPPAPRESRRHTSSHPHSCTASLFCKKADGMRRPVSPGGCDMLPGRRTPVGANKETSHEEDYHCFVAVRAAEDKPDQTRWQGDAA